ncbi:Acetyltransferase [Pseudooceanicola marinus]|uniref:[Ribosomal protein bS18]-alanine N-acetyltransferase n=1 Tax=Pseudooceanicola marinus TaxID=396013 RepID=A0A1X7A046_9RHOB|nr:ribosomal protein S18-alanine N-acetyltransferase [Pseudooceanicola marinus]PJE30157.1 ribosomal-protein-alanine N-acetyltransferase [Pseudooceanicola marinus]SLN66189.1 Acetyltransferase [Pseudooceanicola marinus]
MTDTATLARIHAACFTTPRPWTTEELDRLIADPACFLVAKPGGFLLGRTTLDEAEILTLAVDPAHRRQGLGRALVAAFEETARARGATIAFLEVAADNAPAIALYLGAGFVRAGRRPRYYRAPDGEMKDAEILRRDLG